MGMGFKAKATLAAIGTAVAISAASPAQALTMFGLYNTGVDAAGNVVASNQVDLHYRITATTNPGLVIPVGGANAYTVGTGLPWNPNDPVGSAGSGWLTPFVNPDGTPGFSGVLPGTNYDYTYTIDFNIGATDPNDAILSGQVQSDNVVRVLLNGVDIGGQVDPGSPGDTSFFQSFTAFGSNSGFLAGANQLSFVVKDYGVVTGLRVGNIAAGAVPEPGVWAMLIIGFGLVAGQIRRRRRSGTVALA